LLPPQLLSLEGPELGLLVQGLLNSSVLKDSLERRYGLSAYQLKQLSKAPFALRLSSLPSGPFRASLELELFLVQGRSRWMPWLRQLERALQDQNLTLQTAGAETRLWLRDDGTTLGGWRWLSDRQILLSLGSAPSRRANATALPSTTEPWRLRMRPQALVKSQLLPQELPLVVQRAESLSLLGLSRSQRAGERQTALDGRLNLR
jgi:hypothetical protein